MDITFDEIEVKDVRALITTIKEQYNYDFSDYAVSSFKRRIQRILQLYKIKTPADLIKKVSMDKAFCEEVVKEITVNTTEMFRDPSFWQKIRDEILPNISKNNNIRIWHAACSSGEEVYSMAILLKEANLLDKAAIYATDINDQVLSTAQKGIYSKRGMERNESNYAKFNGKGDSFSKYYTVVDENNIKMNSSLISNVTFRKHDLVLGQAFSKFDLIICRNVMIYFNFSLQDKVVNLFHKSLFPGSYLGIGSKETIAWCPSGKYFKTINIEDKIYKKSA